MLALHEDTIKYRKASSLNGPLFYEAIKTNFNKYAKRTYLF